MTTTTAIGKMCDCATGDLIEEAGFILLSDLGPIVPLHPQQVRKLVRAGKFPPIFKIGGRTAFRRAHVRAWSDLQTPLKFR